MSSFLASLLAGSNAGAITPQTDETTGMPSPAPQPPAKKTLNFGAKKAEPVRNPQPPTGTAPDPISVAVGLPGDRPLDVRMQPKEKAPILDAPMTLDDWKNAGSGLTSSIGKFNALVSGTAGQGPLSYTEATKRYWSSLSEEEQQANPFHRLLGKAQSYDPTDPTHEVIHSSIEHLARAHSVPDGQPLFNNAVHHAIRASGLKPKTDPLYWKAQGSKLGEYRTELESLRRSMDPNNPEGLTQYEQRKKTQETGVKTLTGAIAKMVGQSVLADITKQASPERTGITETKGILESIVGSGDGEGTPMSRLTAMTREYIEAYDFDKTELGKDLIAKAANNTLTPEDITRAAQKWNVRQFIEPRLKPSGITDPAEFTKAHQEYKAGAPTGVQGLGRYSSPDFMHIYTGHPESETLGEQRVQRGLLPYANMSEQETVPSLGKSGLDSRSWGPFDSRANLVGALFSGMSLTDDQTRTLAAKMGFNTTAERNQFVMGTGMDGMSGEALMAMEGRVGAITNAAESVERDTSNTTLAKKVLTGAGWVKNSRHFTLDQKTTFNARLRHISDIATAMTETATEGAVGKGKKQSIAIYHPFALTTTGEGDYEMKDPIGSFKAGHFDMYRPATDISLGPQTVFQTALMFEHAASNTPYRSQMGYLAKSALQVAGIKEQLDNANTALSKIEVKEGNESARNDLKATIAQLEKSLKTVGSTSQIKISPVDFEKRVRLAANRVYKDAMSDPAFKNDIEGKIGINIDGNAVEFTTALLNRLQDPAAGPRVMKAVGDALLGADAIVKNTQTKGSGKNTASPTERSALRQIDVVSKAQSDFKSSQLGIPLQELVTKHKPQSPTDVDKARAALGGDLTLTPEEQQIKSRVAQLTEKQATDTGLTEDEDAELSARQKALADSVAKRATVQPQGVNKSNIDTDVWGLLTDNAKYLIPKVNQKEFIGPNNQLTEEGKRYLQSTHNALSSWVQTAASGNASQDSRERALNAIQFPADAITNIRPTSSQEPMATPLSTAYKLFPAYDPASKKTFTPKTDVDRKNETIRDKIMSAIGTAHLRLPELESKANTAKTDLETFTALSKEGKETFVSHFDDGRTVAQHEERLVKAANEALDAVDQNKSTQTRLAMQLHDFHNPDVPYASGGRMTEADYKAEVDSKKAVDVATNKHVSTFNNWDKATADDKQAAYKWLQTSYQDGTLPPGFDPLPSVNKGSVGAVTRIAYPSFEGSLDFKSGRWTADYNYPHKPRPYLGRDTVQGKIKVPNPQFSILMKVHPESGVPSFEAVEYRLNGTKKTVFSRQRIHIAGAPDAPHESSFKDGNSYVTNGQYYAGIHQKLDPIEEQIKSITDQINKETDQTKVASLQQQLIPLNEKAQPLRNLLEPEQKYNAITRAYEDRKQAQIQLALVVKALRNTKTITTQIKEIDAKLTGDISDDERAKLTNAKTKLTESLNKNEQSVIGKFGKDFKTAVGQMVKNNDVVSLDKFGLSGADIDLLTNIQSKLKDDATAYETNEQYQKLIAKMALSAKGTPLYELIKRVEDLGTEFKRPDKLTYSTSGDWQLGETANRYTKPARASFKDVGSFIKLDAIMRKQNTKEGIAAAKDDIKLIPIKQKAIARGGFGPNGKLQAGNLDSFVKKMWQVALDESPINLKTTFKKYTDDTPVKYSVARFYNDVWRYLPDHVKANSGVLLQDIPQSQLNKMSTKDRARIETAFVNNSLVLPSTPGSTAVKDSSWNELDIPNRGLIRFDRPLPAWWESQVGQLTPKAQSDVRHAMGVMATLSRMASGQQFPYSVNFSKSGVDESKTGAEQRYAGATVSPRPGIDGPLINKPPQHKMDEFAQNVQRLMGVHPEYAQMSPAQKNTATQRAYEDVLGLSKVYVALNMGWNIRRDAPTTLGSGRQSLSIPGAMRMTPVPKPVENFDSTSAPVQGKPKQADVNPIFKKGELADVVQQWKLKLYPLATTKVPAQNERPEIATERSNIDTTLKSHATLEAGLKIAQGKLSTARSEARSNPSEENINAAKEALASVKRIEEQLKATDAPALRGRLDAINAEFRQPGVYSNIFRGTASEAHAFLSQLKQQHPEHYSKLVRWNKVHSTSSSLTLEDFMQMDPTKITGGAKAKVGALLDGVFADYTPQSPAAKIATLRDLKTSQPSMYIRLQNRYDRNKSVNDPSFEELVKITGKITDKHIDALGKVFDNSSWTKSPVASLFSYQASRPAVEAEPAGKYTPNLGARVAMQLKKGFTPVNAANLTLAEREFVEAFLDPQIQSKSPVRRKEAHRVVGLVIPEVRKNGSLVTPERTLMIDGPEFRTVLRKMMDNPELFKDAKFLQESGFKVFRIGMRTFSGKATGTIQASYDSATRREGPNAQRWIQGTGGRNSQFNQELLSGGKAKTATAQVEISKAALPVSENTVRIKRIGGKAGMTPLLALTMALMDGVVKGVTDVDPNAVVKGNK